MTTQKAEWLLTGGGCIQESNHRGPFPRRGPGGPGISTLWKIVGEKVSLVKRWVFCFFVVLLGIIVPGLSHDKTTKGKS